MRPTKLDDQNTVLQVLFQKMISMKIKKYTSVGCLSIFFFPFLAYRMANTYYLQAVWDSCFKLSILNSILLVSPSVTFTTENPILENTFLTKIVYYKYSSWEHWYVTQTYTLTHTYTQIHVSVAVSCPFHSPCCCWLLSE